VVFRGVSVLRAPARSAYFCLLKPSSMKRRINSAALMPVRFDALASLLICIGVSQIVVRFMMKVVWSHAIRVSRVIFDGMWVAVCLTIRCNDLRIAAWRD
jgi:hypothetical protein